jgi:hypothetical protein
MRHLGIGVFALVALCFTAEATVAEGATDRRVSGVITAVDSGSMTLAPICAKAPVTGKLNGQTRILINGQSARVQDLHVTHRVKAELGLDDAWVSITVSNNTASTGR